MTDFSGALPRTFDVDSVPKVKDEKCNLCTEKYRKLTDLRLGGSKANNCFKCGISVCDKCSLNKVQLSQRDETKYKVCNKCHSTMLNAPLISFYQGLLQAKMNAVEGLNSRKSLTKAKVEHL